MEKIVQIKVKKIPIKTYIEDFSEITFRKPVATNAEIYIHHSETILTKKPDLTYAIPLVTWVYDTKDARYISTLYFIDNKMIREVIVYDKIISENETRRKRKYGFYLQYRETLYFEVELP